MCTLFDVFLRKMLIFNGVSKGLEPPCATTTADYAIESTYSKYQHGCIFYFDFSILFLFVHSNVLTYFMLFEFYLIHFINQQSNKYDRNCV